MPEYDLPLDELRTYRPPRDEPTDFDLFWKQTLADSRGTVVRPELIKVDHGLSTLDTYDLTFQGYQGQPVRAWLILPRQRSGPLPAIVQFVGYGGGRGLAIEHLLWASAGYAHLVMDCRGQGGETPDTLVSAEDRAGSGRAVVAAGVVAAGEVSFVTRGSLDPATYYYRRVFTDAVRAVEAARTLDTVDPQRVTVAGTSQGGGIALAVAALEPSVVGLLCDMPFLCHWPRAVRIALRPPYTDVAELCARLPDRAARVMATLRYFDVVNFAARASVPAMFSVALMDGTCPPSTVFAAYNHYAGAKDIIVYPFNDHEGGGAHHAAAALRRLQNFH